MAFAQILALFAAAVFSARAIFWLFFDSAGLGAGAALPGLHALDRLQGHEKGAGTTLLVVSGGIGLFAAAAVTVLAGDGVIGLSAGVIAALVPVSWALGESARAARQVDKELPRALRALARLSKAGVAPLAALQSTADEVEGRLRRELRQALDEQRSGALLADALRAMSSRIPGSVDLRIFVNAIVLTTESGGDLGELMTRIEATVSERIELRENARAEMARAKLNAFILIAVPPLGGVGLWLLSPKVLADTWADPLGKAMYQGAAVWMVIGVLSIASLLRGRS